ncbi:hypothetical protein ACP70R_007646 [Stipagrostis hirtigluma subsp. patula]
MAGFLKLDEVTRMVSVQMFVLLTTVLLLVRFILDFFGPWYTNWSILRFIVPAVEALTYSLVHYTMGLMQLSGAKVNDYFQVWAVLLVTLQYSVKVGRPYSRSMQIPLLDIMSSLWTANLIRVQTFLLLRIPLWLIWALNAARILAYFSSSDKAKEINQENMRLVGDYMSYEDKLGSPQFLADVADPGQKFTMKGYKYLVLGEDQVLKDLQKDPNPEQGHGTSQRRKHGIQLDPEVNKKLITVDKIWDVDGGKSGLLGDKADPSHQLKDVCLSFALYKLLRRRFYNLLMHEARSPRKEKIKRLVFQYILQDAERAFRVVATELSFLQDMFYSKHAAMFAAGFPVKNFVLSLLLIVASGYIAYPVRYIPERMAKADHNRITHGVFITRIMVALIVIKELAEIYLYVFSQWTKVLMLCNYAKHQCLRLPLVGWVMKAMLFPMIRGKWDEKIRQHNILISAHCFRYKGIKLEACTKQAIFESFKRLEKEPERLESYFCNAFGAPDQAHKELPWAIELEADTHRILVWHIATCLCEINLASNKATTLRWLQQRPYVKKPKKNQPDSCSSLPTMEDCNEVKAAVWWEHYTTAVTLSNYCAYLVAKSLVPDNGIVAKKVIKEVTREIRYLILDCSIRSIFRFISIQDVFDRIMRTVHVPHQQEKPNKEAQQEHKKKEPVKRHGDRFDIMNSLTRKGAMLAKQLMEKYKEDKEGLWEKLSAFWTGFLLHLAASTRASKHKTHLAGNRELTTHLWALLSHAGFLGRNTHGQTVLDPEDLRLSHQHFELPNNLHA